MEYSEEQDLFSEGKNEDENWHPFSSFVIEFQERKRGSKIENQTIIHHMESAEGTTWAGIECKQIGQWIINHLYDTDK